MSIPAAGDVAPDVALPDATGTVHRLADQRGRWTILYFYPKDDTPGCTTEACDFRDGIQNFTKMDAVVVGCSPDSPERHRTFIAKYKLKVELLSDPDHKMMSAYRAWGEKMLGRGIPRPCGNRLCVL